MMTLSLFYIYIIIYLLSVYFFLFWRAKEKRVQYYCDYQHRPYF